MIVKMEAASFIGSVLKERISPNRALWTYILLVLLLDFLLFLYLLVVSIDRNHISCLCCAFLSYYTIDPLLPMLARASNLSGISFREGKHDDL